MSPSQRRRTNLVRKSIPTLSDSEAGAVVEWMTLSEKKDNFGGALKMIHFRGFSLCIDKTRELS